MSGTKRIGLLYFSAIDALGENVIDANHSQPKGPQQKVKNKSIGEDFDASHS